MPDAVPPALHHRLSYLLGKLHGRTLEQETPALAPLGLDVKQHAVLALLADEGALTQQQLGQRLAIDRTTIVSVIDALEAGAFVERRRDPADRRAYRLTVTRLGHRARERGQKAVDAAEAEALGALSATQRRALLDLLARALEV